MLVRWVLIYRNLDPGLPYHRDDGIVVLSFRGIIMHGI